MDVMIVTRVGSGYPSCDRPGSSSPSASAGVAQPSTRRGRWLSLPAGDRVDVVLGERGQVGLLVQVLAQQPIRRSYVCQAAAVPQIAERAGLTKSTFFRHFPDKREVLFGGGAVNRLLRDAIVTAPAAAGPLQAVAAGLDVLGGTTFTTDIRESSSRRQAVIAAPHRTAGTRSPEGNWTYRCDHCSAAGTRCLRPYRQPRCRTGRPGHKNYPRALDRPGQHRGLRQRGSSNAARNTHRKRRAVRRD